MGTSLGLTKCWGARDMATSRLQESVPFDRRVEEANRILAKYPDRIPVICEKASHSNLPEIEKKKFLVPTTMLCGEFKYIIHKHINETAQSPITADETIYLFANSCSPRTGAKVDSLISGNGGLS